MKEETKIDNKELLEAKQNIKAKEMEIEKLKEMLKVNEEKEIEIEKMKKIIKGYETEREKNSKVTKEPKSDAYLKEIESYKEKLSNFQNENEKKIKEYKNLIKKEMIKSTLSKYAIKETTRDLLIDKINKETNLDSNNKLYIMNENGLPKSNDLGSQLTLDDHINNLKTLDINTESFAFFKEDRQQSGEPNEAIGSPVKENTIPVFSRDMIPSDL